MDSPLDIVERGLGPDPAQVREVLVLCPGGLGKVVRAVPALRHLRGVYPDARVSVVAGATPLELLRGCPYVDRGIDQRRPSEAIVERFDVAISLAGPDEPQEKLARPIALTAVDSSVRVAYRDRDETSTLPVHPVWPARLGDAHRMLRLVWLLGGERADDNLGLWPTLADRNGAAALVGDVRGPIAVVHPGAGTSDRRWGTRAYARLIDTIAAIGVHPVVVGSGRDRAIANQISQLTMRPWSDLVGRTGVGVLAGVMERASLFVGNDSGPAALALALGTHSVVIGPRTSLEQAGSARRVSYVTAGPCATCGEMSCSHSAPPARSVPHESVHAEVATAARHALRRWRAERWG